MFCSNNSTGRFSHYLQLPRVVQKYSTQKLNFSATSIFSGNLTDTNDIVFIHFFSATRYSTLHA